MNYTLKECNTSKNFDLIRYSRPFNKKSSREITEIIGLDTETYDTGKPFLFCFSDGGSCGPEEIPLIFFSARYRNNHFGVYNLKFDSGSILHFLPVKKRAILRVTGKVKYKNYTIKYIPHKYLRITNGKDGVTIWNILQYFKMSLDSAAKKYLNKSKIELETKTFTIAYVSQNYEKIKSYCVQDSILVKQLYDYLLKGFSSINLIPSGLYSTAYLSFQYFKDNNKIVNVWRYWKNYNEVLRYAYESYAGGKFEIYARGRFNGIMYDINSAYPAEMSELLDVSFAKVKFIKGVDICADYGFLRVIINNKQGLSTPCPYVPKNLCIYPAGVYHATITLQEYLYLQEIKIKVKIIDGWYLYIEKKRRVYNKIVNTLYEKKTIYKEKDIRLSNTYKMILNSFYGKMIQKIETQEGTLKAGAGFNPIYASIITANVRIKLSKIYNEYPEHILAVHTDSIISTKPVDSRLLGNKIGEWQEVCQGDGLLIACGSYQIKDHVATRCFKVNPAFNWFDFLKSQGNNILVTLPQIVVKSWIQANIQNCDEDTNKFVNEFKEFNLNIDRKRLWFNKTNADKLLNTLETSSPHFVYN